MALRGEQKELTVLFSDIRGFTSISERMTAEELADFLNDYLTPMADIVMEGRGCVDKFMGDAVMAFWGAPLDNPNHPRDAARAALKMMETLRAMQGEWSERGLPVLDIGIGLNTGLMSVGNMGSKSRFDYTVMGDAVNLGSRLEGINKTYGTNIIVSQTLRDYLVPDFTCRRLDRVMVKGKKEPITIFELIQEGSPPEEVRNEVWAYEEALDHYLAKDFVGARTALAKLRETHPHRRVLYDVYLERIDAYLIAPPPADWDGVYVFTHK
jgi:adenylate cyclase